MAARMAIHAKLFHASFQMSCGIGSATGLPIRQDLPALPGRLRGKIITSYICPDLF